MEMIIYIIFLAGVALFVWGLADLFISRHVRVELPQERPELKRARIQSILLMLLPFSRTLMQKLRIGPKLRDKLDAGHLHISSLEFFSVKLILAIALAIAAATIIKNVEPIIILAAFFVGYIIPDSWLNYRIARRKNAIIHSLPETMDLLGLCVEAGLDFTTAVKWIIEKTPNSPMIEELALVLEQIKWGKPRVQTLKDMSKRLNMIEISSFVQTLVQAEKMGTPVAEAFSILAEESLNQRFVRGERIAIKAPLKMLIPLIFCILPVIAIVVGGPIMLQFMQGDFLKGF